ncbi:MAG: flagellar biosynthesis protein FlhF [Syntrophaceae bacterium]|nr:flagellar biosynthesis protein FlhF [Syntrophaceae bacterium]
MQVKRYEAKSIQEALAKIKKELGADAIILSSKELSGGRNPVFEVVAAKDTGEGIRTYSPRSVTKATVNPPEPAITTSETGPEWHGLKDDIGELKTLLRELKKRDEIFDEFGEVKDRLNVLFDLLGLKDKGDKKPLSQVYSRLVAQGVSKKSACVLLEMLNRGATMERIGAPEEGLRMVEDLIRNRLKRKQANNQEGRIKVFVGPTGVGKTTTIAKLAAHYALNGKHQVALATTDTYRIAAPEQLRTYARIMDIPMQVAADANGLKKTIAGFAHHDIILVDTPGMGLNDRAHFERMHDLFGARDGVEMNLLLSLSASQENLYDTLVRYKDLRIDQVILTKVDECRRFGFLFDLMERAQKPVPYVTTGQSVPQDIREVNSGNLAKLIVGGTLH